MNRSNFFKSLVTLLASPSIISEIDWDKKQDPFSGKPIRLNTQILSEGNVIIYDAEKAHRVISDEFPKWHFERNIGTIYYEFGKSYLIK